MPRTSRYGRRILTPEEKAQELRDAAAARRERARQVAQQRRQAQREAELWIRRHPPEADAARRDLDNMAKAIHDAYNWNGHGDECVTAIVRMRSGEHVVFPQRKMLAMERYAKHHYPDIQFTFLSTCDTHHLHAEMYALRSIINGLNGYDFENVVSIGVSKPICPDCRGKLIEYNVDYDDTYITAASSNHWVAPD